MMKVRFWEENELTPDWEDNMTLRKHLLFLILTVWIFIETSCTPEIVSTAFEKPTASAVPVTLDMSSLLIQAENESVEEFVIRIAARRIINKRPFLVTLSQMENKENFWFGVSPDIKNMEKCWIYETDAIRQCASEDIKNFFGNQEFPNMFFAFAYSNSTQNLYILDYYHPWVRQDLMDGYRLVMEFQNGKWIEKSITPVY